MYFNKDVVENDHEKDKENEIQSGIISYLTENGGNVGIDNTTFTHVPFSLYPTLFSAELFQFGKEIAPLFNVLVDRIARNKLNSTSKDINISESWLESVLKATSEVDDFTKHLLDIYREVEKQKVKDPSSYQPIQLGILRSDYMVHDNSRSGDNEVNLFQVELNTIASSFGSLSTIISEAHQYMSKRYSSYVQNYLKTSLDESTVFNNFYPKNDVLNKTVNALAKGHNLFIKQLNLSTEISTSILMVILDDENNVFDQRMIEHCLFEKFGISLERKSFSDIAMCGQLRHIDKHKNILCINNTVISLAYFRSGYSPTNYKNEDSWKVRKMIELSKAIKCPSISYHLAGTKKVQQALTIPGELEKFLKPEECLKIRKCFVKIYTLDVNEMTLNDTKAVEKAMFSKDFVLKPSREGGGNNFYGLNVGEKLRSLSDVERKGFILMERIYPKALPVKLLRKGVKQEGNGVYELGMFSTILTDSNEEIVNEYVGYLLRLKFENVDEGGVATGYSCLGSLALVE